MTKSYDISRKFDIGRALIIIFLQSTLLEHDDHHVLQERTMNINKNL